MKHLIHFQLTPIIIITILLNTKRTPLRNLNREDFQALFSTPIKGTQKLPTFRQREHRPIILHRCPKPRRKLTTL